MLHLYHCNQDIRLTPQIFSNIVVNIVLLILYISFFGVQSIQKYFDNGVTIINHEEKSPHITPPGK